VFGSDGRRCGKVVATGRGEWRWAGSERRPVPEEDAEAAGVFDSKVAIGPDGRHATDHILG
jgi:hypothetical protein